MLTSLSLGALHLSQLPLVVLLHALRLSLQLLVLLIFGEKLLVVLLVKLLELTLVSEQQYA